MLVRGIPLSARVVIGVVLGAVTGIVFGTGDILPGIAPADLGKVGLLVIRLLKMLAVPLVAFAILDAIARSDVSGRSGVRLVFICLMNVSVAMVIGLLLMNVFVPGEAWQGHIDQLSGLSQEALKQAPPDTSLSPIDNLVKWIPESAVQPLAENNVIAVVLLSILAGAAIRRLHRNPDTTESISSVVRFVEGGYAVLTLMLSWVIELVPFAVFCVVAHVVGKTGLDTLTALWSFLAIILVGMTIHALGYYTLMAWLVGGKPPRVYLGTGATAILTGLSTNSSLATVPVTLKTLEKMDVTPESSRLAACIGTNLNNDGITLYEAMAALFLAQALGYDLSYSAQLTIVLASLMAAIGVAGVPEAGLIVLPLVLSAAGLPEPVVAALLPIVFAVDWILARGRTIVNVMNDMLVAILLDRWARGPRPHYPPRTPTR